MTIPSRLLLGLALLSLVGCGSTPPAVPHFFSPEATDLYGGHGRRRDYTLTLDLRFEKRPFYNEWVGMELALSQWQEAHGRRFVLERQRQPAATLFTYFQGLFSKSFHIDVKTLVERRDPKFAVDTHKSADATRAITRGKQVIAAWEKRYPGLARKYPWKKDPRIVHYSPVKLRGRFGFYRTLGATLFFEPSGQVRTDTIANRVEEIYRWHSADKPDPVTPSNFFPALLKALEAFDPSPFPEGDPELLEDTDVGQSWTARNTRSIVSFARAVVKINPNLTGFLNHARQEPFELICKLARRDGDVDRITCESTQFKGDLGQGYRLTRFRREVRYDRKQQVVLEDSLLLEARGQGADRVEMRLVLVASEP